MQLQVTSMDDPNIPIKKCNAMKRGKTPVFAEIEIPININAVMNVPIIKNFWLMEKGLRYKKPSNKII